MGSTAGSKSQRAQAGHTGGIQPQLCVSGILCKAQQLPKQAAEAALHSTAAGLTQGPCKVHRYKQPQAHSQAAEQLPK